MEPGPYEQVPLTDDDKNLLLTIYNNRMRLLFSAYVILIAIAFFCSFKGIDYQAHQIESCIGRKMKMQNIFQETGCGQSISLYLNQL